LERMAEQSVEELGFVLDGGGGGGGGGGVRFVLGATNRGMNRGWEDFGGPYRGFVGKF
jgi:hypothetical protein